MRIAYVVNQYPKVTHTFVRTEIGALEHTGVQVDRVAIRRADSPLLDPADREEAARTRVVIERGGAGLAAALLYTAATRPAAFARAAGVALRIGRQSERGVMRHLAYLAEACVLLRWTAAWRSDHLHATFGSNPAAVTLLCRLLGGPPYSFTAHGPEEFERPHVLGIREKVEHAAFVTVVSEAGRRHLQQSSPLETWDRMHLVRCGIDSRFRQHPATPVPAEPRIVYVGRLCLEKAPLVLLEAVARVNASGHPCDLTMIGNGPLFATVAARIAALGLSDRVRLVGWASGDDVQRHILAARALVLPSFAEGLPVVLMEALALHRPVICTPVGGVAELVDAGVSGWLVPPGSVDALAGAIREALTAAPAQLAEMGAAAPSGLHNNMIPLPRPLRSWSSSPPASPLSH